MTRKTVNWTVSSLFLLAVALIGIGLWYGRETGPSLVIDSPTKSFGEGRVGEFAPASFTLSNRTSRPIRVVGASQSCVNGGCLKGLGLPVTIPPHASADVTLGVQMFSTCDFRAAVDLYTDCPGQMIVPLEVTGHITPKSGPDGLTHR